MAIRIAQPGLAELYGTAAVGAGRARGRERAAERAARSEAEFLRFAAQQAESVERTERVRQELDFKTELRKLDYQAALERERRSRAAQIEREDRAKAWDIEKMEMRSRIDFEREEGVRQKKLDGIDSSLAQIEKDVKSGKYSPTQVENYVFKLEQEREFLESGAFGAPAGGLTRGRESALSLLGGAQPGGVSPATDITENPLGLNIVTPTTVSMMPPEQLELMREQKFRVISPEGDEETIKESDWADYKARGYILAEIPELRERLAGKPLPAKQYFPFY